MKLLSVLSILVLSAFAAPNANAYPYEQDIADAAVECDTFGGDMNIYLRITGASGGGWQDADLYVRSGDGGHYNYSVVRQGTGFTDVRYWGANFDLNIDVFSTGGARYYQTYDAELTSADVNGGKAVKARCEFMQF